MQPIRKFVGFSEENEEEITKEFSLGFPHAPNHYYAITHLWRGG